MKKFGETRTSANLKSLANPVHPVFKKKTPLDSKVNSIRASKNDGLSRNISKDCIDLNNQNIEFVETNIIPKKTMIMNNRNSNKNSSVSLSKKKTSRKKTKSPKKKRENDKNFIDHISEQDDDSTYSNLYNMHTMLAKKNMASYSSKPNLTLDKIGKDIEFSVHQETITKIYKSPTKKINENQETSILSIKNESYLQNDSYTNLNETLDFLDKQNKSYKKSDVAINFNSKELMFESMVEDDSFVVKNKPRNKQITDKIDKSFLNQSRHENSQKIAQNRSDISEKNTVSDLELNTMNVILDLPIVSEQNLDLETTDRNRNGYDTIENYIDPLAKVSDRKIENNLNNYDENPDQNIDQNEDMENSQKDEKTPEVHYFDHDHKSKESNEDSISDFSPNTKDFPSKYAIEYEEKHQALVAKCNELENELSKKNSTISELTTKSQGQIALISEDKKKINDLHKKLVEQSYKIQELEALEQVTVDLTSNNDLTSKDKEFKNEISSLKDSLEKKEQEVENLKNDYDSQINKLQKSINEKNDEIKELEDCMNDEIKDNLNYEIKDEEIADQKDKVSCLEFQNDNFKYMVDDKFQKMKEYMAHLAEKDQELFEQCTLLEKRENDNKLLKEMLSEKCQELAEAKREIENNSEPL